MLSHLSQLVNLVILHCLYLFQVLLSHPKLFMSRTRLVGVGLDLYIYVEPAFFPFTKDVRDKSLHSPNEPGRRSKRGSKTAPPKLKGTLEHILQSLVSENFVPALLYYSRKWFCVEIILGILNPAITKVKESTNFMLSVDAHYCQETRQSYGQYVHLPY